MRVSSCSELSALVEPYHVASLACVSESVIVVAHCQLGHILEVRVDVLILLDIPLD